MNLDLQSSLNSIKEELKTVNPDEIESDIFPSFSCELCALEFTSDEILKEQISNVHDTIPDGQKQCLGVICATMSPSPRRVSRSIEDLSTKQYNPPPQANHQPRLENRLQSLAFYKVMDVQTF